MIVVLRWRANRKGLKTIGDVNAPYLNARPSEARE